MSNFADRLMDKIKKTNNPTVMGLDPLIDYVPDSIIKKYTGSDKTYAETVSLSILEFNIRLIDSVKGVVPAVKPQLAYYEMLGIHGMECFQKTVRYAADNGFIVIADGKRNDILSTAQCYSKAYLGGYKLPDNSLSADFESDALTVNPYLGYDGIKPFVDLCESNGKGIFVLVRTSNPSAIDFQDIKTSDNKYVYEKVAEKVSIWGKTTIGENGYSSVGAVVGATWPQQSLSLRRDMPNAIILVPGYGAQGGGADDAVAAFDNDGNGAIVNASRSLMCAYKNIENDKERFEEATVMEAIKMRDALNEALDRKRKLCEPRINA